MSAPVLALNFAQRRLQQLVVIDEFRAKILPLFEGVFLEQSLTEAVDGEDRRLIEVIDRRLEDRTVLVVVLQGAFQGATQTRFEVASGFFGEGDEENLFEGDGLLFQ